MSVVEDAGRRGDLTNQFAGSREVAQSRRASAITSESAPAASATIVTGIVPASTFYMAEDHHQEYFERVGGGNPYCSFVIEPKVAKFRKHFVERLKR